MSTTIEDPRLQTPGTDPAATTPAPEGAQPPGDGQTPEPLRAMDLATVEQPLTREEIMRPAIGALATTLGAAFLVGGMFTGFMPRIYAALGGILGVAMAVWAARATKRVTLIQSLSLAGILFGGIVLLGVGDLGAVSNLGKTIGEAVGNARLRRPPAPFDPGWKAVLPWTLGMIGYAAAWVGSVGRKPALGVLVPIPVIAFSSIAQPSEAQVPAGIVAFVTFVIGLTVIYRADRGEGEGVSTAYELKRAARAAPLVLLLVAALVGLSQTNLLFPAPLYDPTERAQLPKAIPLKGVNDRVLFSVVSPIGFTGPWRAGVLDVYDGESWRLPPYSASDLKKAPADGIIDKSFGTPQQPKLRARVTIEGMEGTVLPLPQRPYGIAVDSSPPLVVDPRTETVRVEQGQVSSKLAYDILFNVLPRVEDLRKAGAPNNDLVEEFTDVAGRPMPPTVAKIVQEARSRFDNQWDRLDFVRGKLIDSVTSTGQGLPSPVPPSKIEDMFSGSKEASPYEFIAAQALLARWLGVPSRIGYGFDRGEQKGAGGTSGGQSAVGQTIEYRPKHGAAWLEVYFQGYGWFPVTGLPKKAKASLGNDSDTLDAQILPSDEIAVQLFIPLRVTPKNLLFKQIQKALLLASPFIITILLAWLLWPVAYKARRRSRRKHWALEQGPSARIAVAYADLRDHATDLGVGDPYLTPLAYLQKVVPDDEHRELAWLVTRCLWGDLRHTVSNDEVLAAEELSRSLRRRMFEAQPFTIRGIALVSRLSLRNPYAPELLSPPLQRLGIKRLVRLPKLGKRKKKETLDEAIEAA